MKRTILHVQMSTKSSAFQYHWIPIFIYDRCSLNLENPGGSWRRSWGNVNLARHWLNNERNKSEGEFLASPEAGPLYSDSLRRLRSYNKPPNGGFVADKQPDGERDYPMMHLIQGTMAFLN